MALVDVTRTEKITIPHEKDQWMEIHALTGGQMEEASSVKTGKVIAQFGSMMDTLAKSANVSKEAETEAKASSFDADIIISYALVAWSYEAECNKENKQLLDGRTRDWLHNLIVERNTFSGPLERS